MGQDVRVLRPDALRTLGASGLAALLRRRPDALEPVPPRSLKELAERLTHPVSLSLALRGFDTPTVQTAEALAALGEGADRSKLERLLGIAPGPDGDGARAALDRALGNLREHLFLDPDVARVRLLPEICSAWPEPLGLGAPVAKLVPSQTAEAIRAALRELGVTTKVSLKADLVRALVDVLADPQKVRAAVAQAPPHVAERLRQAAAKGLPLFTYTYYSFRFSAPRTNGPIDPAHWALARMLCVQTYDGRLEMPAEVTMALRGPEWTAPFDPDPPPVRWQPRSPEFVEREMAAAAGSAVRTVTAVLDAAGTRPLPLLKSGAVGVRELRRLAKTVGAATADVRLALALAQGAGLLRTAPAGAAPTRAFDAWLDLAPAARVAALSRAWLELPALPMLDPDTAWLARAEPGAPTAKSATLGILAAHPMQAAPAEDLAALAAWAQPLPFGGTLSTITTPARAADPDDDLDVMLDEDDLDEDDLEEDDLDEDDLDDDDLVPLEVARRLVPAALAEAAWLGLVGAGALTPAGRAALGGGDVEAAVGGAVGPLVSTARLQADLTAVVLGQPTSDLAATLDGMADREGRSAAATWRFSPASLRRALDGGSSAEQLVKQLTEIADGGVPQPLEYLVGDVARRHGLLRGGTVQCYLRSTDEPLLREVVADRRFGKLGLRRLAPDVVVGQRPLAETLAMLRSGGYAPVEEGPEGETVLARTERHRAPQASATRRRAPDQRGTSPRESSGPIDRISPEAVAAALLRERRL
jgi:Helicase conserved C-terminal domain